MDIQLYAICILYICMWVYVVVCGCMHVSDVSTCRYKLCQINIILILNSMLAILYNRCAYIHGTIGVISVGTPCHT